MNYQQLNGKTIAEGFMLFHNENKHVYDAFKEQALRAINAGRKKISSKLIVNYIRWNESFKTSDQNFKINDAYQSMYARLFVTEYPQYYDRFNFRKLRSVHDGQYMEVDEHGYITFI